ncbi:MAG: hypothetical protein E3K37_01390 [Candidatus Kuenenia sp.]|nr:hypothetical protein [Candidatus Kuenenia hertensis]
MSVVINVDFSQALRKNKKLQALTRKAIVRSLNRVGDQARTAASKQIREQYNVKAGDISKASKTIRAKASRLQYKIFVRSGRLGLMKYGARKTNKGATVRIKKTGGRKLIPHSFIAPWKKGESEQWVFLRDPKLPKTHRTSRRKDKAFYLKDAEARRSLFGPSITQLYANKKVAKKIRDTIDQNLTKRLNHELNFLSKGMVNKR